MGVHKALQNQSRRDLVDDREQLAHSDTPLSAFADVTTPEQAMARFESLDDQRKMQLMAMFMRVDNDA